MTNGERRKRIEGRSASRDRRIEGWEAFHEGVAEAESPYWTGFYTANFRQWWTGWNLAEAGLTRAHVCP